MIQATKRDAIEVEGYLEGQEGGADGHEIQVAESDVRTGEGGGLVLADHSDTHFRHAVKVVVECLRSFGGGERLAALAQEGLQCPVTRPASRDHAGKAPAACPRGPLAGSGVPRFPSATGAPA